MKLGVVVQRYGADINGGAELHARYVAEHLSRHAEVDVLTTCARDYVTWRNELPPGDEQVNGVTVRRFPVKHERDVDDFGRRSNKVFERAHSLAAELTWLDSEGPASPPMLRYIKDSVDRYDYLIFFSYRYYHAYHGIRAAHSRALLVPTAERDPAAGLSMFRPIFRGVRALMYNSYEERSLINHAAGNEDVPGVVVGIGSALPESTNPGRFRKKFGIKGRYAIYVGRIDENKGCRELFNHFQRYAAAEPQGVSLVLVGSSILPVPDHPRIRHLGFLSDDDKFDAIAASDVLIMPSYFESLSMVAIEAWGLGRPVLANAKCDVLKGQCIRSNAGLYYDDYEEFAEALHVLVSERRLNDALGRNGRGYFCEHYAWTVIERKYLDMLDRLQREDREGAGARPIEPLPGFFARYRRDLPPGREVLDSIPAGPVIPERRRQVGSKR